MLLLVKEHAKFTLDNVIATSTTITTKFNKCDRERTRQLASFSLIVWTRALLSRYLNGSNLIMASIECFNPISPKIWDAGKHMLDRYLLPTTSSTHKLSIDVKTMQRLKPEMEQFAYTS